MYGFDLISVLFPIFLEFSVGSFFFPGRVNAVKVSVHAWFVVNCLPRERKCRVERDLPRHTQFEAPAPVMGGMRWSTDRRERSEDYCRLIGVPHRIFEAEEILPAPVVHVGPHFTTAPPEGARAGEEYVYRPRAHDASVTGFTWSLKKCPPGMEIERYSGKITWTPAESCRAEVELWAVTHHGRIAKQAWTLCVGKRRAVRAVTPSPRFIEALRRKRLRAARRLPFASAPRTPGAKAEASRLHGDTITALRLVWRGARRTTARACPATAPPIRPSGAAVLPLRL